ncbi:uncharacterized protein [Asterias amurensis]|uniref:uncharacterized protein isoform X1 n=2 Tax=Asterias amurensis TaxID=7602 RepID=UPI003AB30CAE
MDLPPIPDHSTYAHFVGPTTGKVKISLLDLIHNYHPYDQIAELIEDDPDAVHKQGWHGLTPMHKAALRGDPKITRLLLDHSASVNEANDYGETPLHYACKRGSLMNIHMMLEGGEEEGDVWQRDNAGRNCLHHAAAGGSVLSMHYLSEVHGMAFHDRDSIGQTPLHIACLQGFQDAIKYLLRNNRSELTWTDNNGNTALHIACQNALSEACWILLQHGNCGMLKVNNNHSQTPLHVLLQGETHGHQQLFKEMNYWADSKTPNLPPKGPMFTWYFMLTLPAHFFGLIMLVCGVIGSYSSVVATVAIVFLASYVGGQSHRLHHLSRWSNPIFCGAFAAGMFHTALCLFVKLHPVIFPVNTYIHFLVDLPLFCVMFYLYYVLLFRDPGRIPRSKAILEDADPCIRDVATGKTKADEFCICCEITVPDRARHCKMCEQCMLGIDHHCLFLLSCIAKDNHRHFVTFILVVMLSQVIFILYSIQYLFIIYPGHTLWEMGVAVVHKQPWVWSMCLLNLLSIIWGVSLVFMQLQLIANGVTMVWRPKVLSMKKVHAVYLSPSAKMKNLRNFFAGRRTMACNELNELQKI